MWCGSWFLGLLPDAGPCPKVDGLSVLCMVNSAFLCSPLQRGVPSQAESRARSPLLGPAVNCGAVRDDCLLSLIFFFCSCSHRVLTQTQWTGPTWTVCIRERQIFLWSLPVDCVFAYCCPTSFFGGSSAKDRQKFFFWDLWAGEGGVKNP